MPHGDQSHDQNQVQKNELFHRFQAFYKQKSLELEIHLDHILHTFEYPKCLKGQVMYGG